MSAQKDYPNRQAALELQHIRRPRVRPPDAAAAEAAPDWRGSHRPASLHATEPFQRKIEDYHRTRHLFIRRQTALINSIRAHFAEFGIVAPVGRNNPQRLRGKPDRAG